MTIKVLHTASATASGGRNGHTQNSDGLINLDLSVPKDMGGPGKDGTTTPEDLFAAGYAACFSGACDFMAKQLKLSPTDIEVKASVSIGKTESGGFGLSVRLDVQVSGLSQEDAQKVVDAGHGFCPYSLAIKGNVPVEIHVTTA